MLCRLSVTVLFLLAIGAASAQTWREIVPLRSNCEDLKRIMGISRCLNTTYDFADAKVTIAFSDGTCATGWNVKEGTVLFIEVHPKAPLKLEDLDLDEALYQKTVDSHLPEVTHYRNQDRGANIAVFSDGTVASLSYGPSTKDKALECASKPEAARPPRASIKFDEYESLSAKEEEVRLKNFAAELIASPNFTGYVIAYGRQGRPREAQERAARVKAYLVSRGVVSDRVSIAEGGHRDHWTIELFLVFKD